MPQDQWRRANNRARFGPGYTKPRVRIVAPPTHMPFGRYRGRRLDTVPRDYLVWFLEHVDCDPELRAAVQRITAATVSG